MSLKQVEVTYNSIKQNLVVTNPIAEEWLRLRLNNLLHNGKDGLDGQDGAKGNQGLSAYEIALNNGFVGTEVEWLASLGSSGNSGGSFPGNTLINWNPEKILLQELINFQDSSTIYPGTIITNSNISANIPEIESMGGLYLIGIDYNDITINSGELILDLNANFYNIFTLSPALDFDSFNPDGNILQIAKYGDMLRYSANPESGTIILNADGENIIKIKFVFEETNLSIYKISVDNTESLVDTLENIYKTISIITAGDTPELLPLTYINTLKTTTYTLNTDNLTPGLILRPTKNFENIVTTNDYLVLANNSLYPLPKEPPKFDLVNYAGTITDLAYTLPEGSSHAYIGYLNGIQSLSNQDFPITKFRDIVIMYLVQNYMTNNTYFNIGEIVYSKIPVGDEVWSWAKIDNSLNSAEYKIVNPKVDNITLGYKIITNGLGNYSYYSFLQDGVEYSFSLYNSILKETYYTLIDYETEIINKPEDQQQNLATVAYTGDYSNLFNTPSFSTVAFSGNYNDLVNKPVLGNTSDIYLEHNSFRLNAQYQIENSRGLVVPFDYALLTLGSSSFYGDRYFVLSNRIIDFRELPQQARRQHQVFIRDSFLMFHVYGINFTIGLTLNTDQSLRSSVTIQNGSPPLLDGNTNFLNPITYLPVTENITSNQRSYVIIYENNTIKLYSKYMYSSTNNSVSTALSTYTYVGYVGHSNYLSGSYEDDYLNFYISSPTSSTFIYKIINKTYKI